MTNVWQTILAGVALLAIGGVAAEARRRARSRRLTAKATLTFAMPPSLTHDPRLSFNVRHVRDGAGGDEGPLRTEAHELKPAPNGRPELTVSLPHTKALGLQFKCFVDYSDMDEEEALESLGRAETVVEPSSEAK